MSERQDGFERVRPPTAEEFFTAFLDIALEGGAAEMHFALARTLVVIGGFDESYAYDLASVLAENLPVAGPSEYGVRVIKPAHPNYAQRRNFIIEAGSYVATLPDSRAPRGSELALSSLAVQYAALAGYLENQEAGIAGAAQLAHRDYSKALDTYITDSVDHMSESITSEQLAERLAATISLSDLKLDLANELSEKFASPKRQ